jgi:LL-diaminopimelate aminotransferase
MDEDFIPKVPKEKYDIIYLCSPNNPSGVCYSYDELVPWIDYAIKNNSVILYDNVYSSFIRSKDKVKSIYEIDGAKKVAIEFKSFSKNASFTGVRCSYYIIPNDISDGINDIWKKRTLNRFNGSDYIAQKGAYASYCSEAKKEINNNIDYYLENAKILRDCFNNLGFKIYGGVDSPFIWVKIKDKISSFEYFKFLLSELNIIVIPGIIFGDNADNYFRVSSLASREVINESIERLNKYYEKEK